MPFVKIHFSGLGRLFSRGKIEKLYEKMYILSEQLAKHELENHTRYMKLRNQVFHMEGGKINKGDLLPIVDHMNAYRDKRQKYHYDEMKQLLEKYLEQKEK